MRTILHRLPSGGSTLGCENSQAGTNRFHRPLAPLPPPACRLPAGATGGMLLVMLASRVMKHEGNRS
jgi:hypothetical protein